MAQVQVRDKKGRGIPLVNIRLSLGHTSSDEAYDDKFTDFMGNSAWPVVLPSNVGYTLYVNYQNVEEKFGNASVHVPNFNEDILIELERSKLDRIVGDELYTRTVSGRDFFFAFETGFLDYYRFLRGENIDRLLAKSEELGSKGRRNFLMTYNTAKAAGLSAFNPDEFGNDFYDRLPEFSRLYESYGLYIYASVFPDNKLLSWGDTNKQILHWNKLCEIGKSLDNFYALELTNEPDGHTFNQVDVNAFSEPSGILACSGSYGDTGGNPMPNPQWSICDYHQPRRYPNSVVDGCVANHPSRLQRNKRILLGEPLGFGDKSLNPNREDNPRIAKEIAGSALGTAIGVCFHSTHGSFSQPYDNIENECAEEFFDVLGGM